MTPMRPHKVLADIAGKKVAKSIFDRRSKRGQRNVEVHLSEDELATAIAAGALAALQSTCADHWHCDPIEASHACDKPDRAKPCPRCGAEP